MRKKDLKQKTNLTNGRREKTRQVLVDAAFRVFAERGFDAPNTDDIVAAAGVARGTFYNYFPTKEDLMRHVAREFVDTMNKEIEALLRGVKDPTERIAARVQYLFHKSVQSSIWGWLLIRIIPLGPLYSHNRIGLEEDLNAGRAAGRIEFTTRQAALDLIQGAAIMGVRSTLLDPGSNRHHDDQMLMLILRALGLNENEALQLIAKTGRLLAEFLRSSQIHEQKTTTVAQPFSRRN